MQLDADHCYRAVLSRDRRFDGRFFTAVRTTGVYCRPVCPAPAPRRENVRFFACAAAAEAAGFRPCRRCHPEAAAGTPAWSGTSATVARALRLIAQGGLDHDGIDALAGRLGVGSRHLRRLFLRQLGAPPGAIARSRRAHFARRLIRETDLPMGRIAHSSGFRSVRQFNQAIRQTFGAAPTELRRDSEPVPGRNGGAWLRLRLPYRPPLDWDRLIGFLRPRAVPGLERIGAGSYRRSVTAGPAHAVIDVRRVAGSACLELRVPSVLAPDLVDLVDRSRRLFDLDADPETIGAVLRGDPELSGLVDAAPGMRVPGCWDRFELGVRAILGQQVTVRGATALMGRLVAAAGDPLPDPPEDGPTHRFPAPDTLARFDLCRMGIPAARAEAIREFARRFTRGRVRLDPSRGLEETVRALTGIPGIGEWTAHYLAMRAAGHPDGFPATDLGLRRALGGRSGPAAAAAVRRRAERWRPWRAYAAMYLWNRDSIAAKRRRNSK